MSTNEQMRQLLNAPQVQAKANCRLIERKDLSGIEREKLVQEIEQFGRKRGNS